MPSREPPRSTSVCGSCHRMVHHAITPDGLVLTDPEVISVVSYARGRVVHARRLHAELCTGYQEQARRAENTAAMRRFTRRQANAAKRGRGAGL